ncbi:immunoglobulin-binding protein 1-like isoform X1 [Sorex fumeus]|uniref:immunoglobulin-binding protein 1-like isoform X1 n=1 Tax=Sorex fumeus TaxID=62283 RepID=UPI0024AD2804|nr:immunoglobulin-binding protein 1-like isoform X1 [Sorex fumeus]
MAAADEEQLPPPPPPPRLPELFEASRQLLDEVEVASEPTGSRAVQDKVLRGLALLQKAADMLAQLDLFRPHAALEEMASADLKYLAVPAFRGALAMKQVHAGRRLDHLQRAREHFVSYLTQCRHFRVADFELPPPPPPRTAASEGPPARPAMADPSLVTMASRRQAKIERYRLREEVEGRLAALRAAVESGQADEERVREYHVLHLRRWVGISLEEVEGIDQELRLLRQNDPSGEASTAARPPPPARPPMKPFVLTRNVAQARVFGAGYPSLASMTVSDWYEQHRRCGALPGAPGRAHAAPSGRRGAARPAEEEREGKDDDDEEEEDDEEARTRRSRRRAREWDDWKDTHPKGYGNRQNMG